jgi:mono/diheme cytochrome c family protein
MRIPRDPATSIALVLLLGLGPAACNTRNTGTVAAAAAVDDGAPDTSAATPPIAPPAPARRDTPPQGAAKPSQPSNQPAGQGLKVSAVEYEGWRQYSVNCARCHGQDVLPNPVAANLLVSLGPNGPIDTPEKFFQVTSAGRADRGMPAFKSLLTPEQINAIYAYVKGRADRRIPPGRPDKPQT